ncbi:MAG: DUF2752 domain-containing protein [Deltaproteobacteria bacterium]|nr:DUF2752 domain-containing protein [Deltaproteobacteria bacterium]
MLLVPAALPLTAGGGIAPEFPLRVPCLFHWASGLPCPFCGMTRAFANLAQGRVAAAWAFSPAGCLLYGLLAVYLAAVLGHLVTGRRVWPQGRGRWAAWSLFIIILAGWLGKLARGSLGAP